jgi:hypothetical protein
LQPPSGLPASLLSVAAQDKSYGIAVIRVD